MHSRAGCPAIFLVIMTLVTAVPASGRAQIPDAFENLQVLPSDIGRDSLIILMRSFSFATGLRCEGCHVMGDSGSFRGAQFHLDDKIAKRQARYMLDMVNRLNEEGLSGLPERKQPPLRVECKTCHRGLRRPHLLRTELREVIAAQGVEAAITRYRELREHAMDDGAYDFGVWEMNELARQLESEGLVEEAVAILELNEEFHPRDPSIPRELGPLHEQLGRTEEAIAAYRRALGLNPRDGRSRDRLDALRGT